MRLRNVWVRALGLALAASVAACGGGSKSEASAVRRRRPRPRRCGPESRCRRPPASVKGAVTLNGTAPKNEPIKMNADPVCLKQAKGTQFAGDLSSSAPTASRSATCSSTSRTVSGNYAYDRAHRRRDAQPAGLPLHAARVRRPRRPAARDPQQRSRRSTTSTRLPKANQRVQQRPADPGHEDDAHVHGQGSDGAVQVRRPRLDERVRRRARSPVLRRDGCAKASSSFKRCPPGTYTIEAWHEKLGADDPERHDCGEGDRRNHLHVERAGGDDDQLVG